MLSNYNNTLITPFEPASPMPGSSSRELDDIAARFGRLAFSAQAERRSVADPHRSARMRLGYGYRAPRDSVRSNFATSERGSLSPSSLTLFLSCLSREIEGSVIFPIIFVSSTQC